MQENALPQQEEARIQTCCLGASSQAAGGLRGTAQFAGTEQRLDFMGAMPDCLPAIPDCLLAIPDCRPDNPECRVARPDLRPARLAAGRESPDAPGASWPRLERSERSACTAAALEVFREVDALPHTHARIQEKVWEHARALEIKQPQSFLMRDA